MTAQLIVVASSPPAHDNNDVEFSLQNEAGKRISIGVPQAIDLIINSSIWSIDLYNALLWLLHKGATASDIRKAGENKGLFCCISHNTYGDMHVTHINQISPNRNAWFDRFARRLCVEYAIAWHSGIAIDTNALYSLSSEIENNINKNTTAVIGQAASLGYNLSKVNDSSIASLIGFIKGCDAQGVNQDIVDSIPDSHGLIRDSIRQLSYNRWAKSSFVDSMINSIQFGVDGYVLRPRVFLGRGVDMYGESGGTVTGRLTYKGFNMHSVPRNHPMSNRMRKIFVAPKGCDLFHSDYNQGELRVLAHLSKDSQLLNDMSKGVDMHKQISANLNGVDVGSVDWDSKEWSDKRSLSKMVVFGIVYGIGSKSLSEQISKKQGIDVTGSDAQGMIDRFMARYQGVHSYTKRIDEYCRNPNREIRTPTGRVMNKAGQATNRRKMLSYLPQSVLSDLTQTSILNMSNRDVRIAWSVHDGVYGYREESSNNNCNLSDVNNDWDSDFMRNLSMVSSASISKDSSLSIDIYTNNV